MDSSLKRNTLINIKNEFRNRLIDNNEQYFWSKHKMKDRKKDKRKKERKDRREGGRKRRNEERSHEEFEYVEKEPIFTIIFNLK